MRGAEPISPRGRSRALFPTDHSDLRVTWHGEGERVVLTLWHDDVCVGSAPLTIADAARLATFLVERLGQRAAEGSVDGSTEVSGP